MRHLLSFFCLGICIYSSVIVPSESYHTAIPDKIRGIFKSGSLATHIVCNIRKLKSRCDKYEYLISSKRSRLALLYKHFWEVNASFDNQTLLEYEIDQTITKHVNVKKPKISLTSVSLLMDEELKGECNAQSLCTSLLKKFKSYGFYVRQKSCLVLDAQTKGLLVWFVENHSVGLLTSLRSYSYPVVYIGQDVASLTFAFKKLSEVKKSEPKNVFNLVISGMKYIVYSSGSEELGLKNARRQIVQEENNGTNASELLSSCLYPDTVGLLKDDGKELTVKGDRSRYTMTNELLGIKSVKRVVDVDKCIAVVKKVVKKFKTKSLPCPGGKFIGVLAYHTFGTMNFYLPNLYTSIETLCTHVRDTDFPFACMDRIYSYVLLNEYFKLTDFDEIWAVDGIFSGKQGWPTLDGYHNIYKKFLAHGRDIHDKLA